MEENEKQEEEESIVETSPFLETSAYGRRRYGTIATVVIVTLILVGGIFFLLRGSQKAPESPLLSPSPPPETQEATPEPELKRSDLKLQVLNGQGRAGVAAKAQEYLEGLGYNVVDVGNAESFDFRETVIRIKKEKQAYANLLREDLEKEYDVADTETLSEDSEFDAVIVVGGPQPSPSPSPSPTPEASPGASPSPSPSPSP